MTFGSLFSGIGGMDRGLELSGMECRWQVEIDRYCQKVLAKHWPNVPKFGDITKLTGDELEPVDLIAGGFPCQDISIEGSRAGIDDGLRSGLWREMFRIIRHLRPRTVLVENVAGMLIPTDGGSAPILRVLGDLSSIGFDAEWSTVSACSVGASHMRQRVFILADTSSLRLERWREERKAERAKALPTATVRWDTTAPRVCSGSDGISSVMDRVKSIGNAVVPQVAQWIGERILELEKASEVTRRGLGPSVCER